MCLLVFNYFLTLIEIILAFISKIILEIIKKKGIATDGAVSFLGAFPLCLLLISGLFAILILLVLFYLLIVLTLFGRFSTPACLWNQVSISHILYLIKVSQFLFEFFFFDRIFFKVYDETLEYFELKVTKQENLLLCNFNKLVVLFEENGLHLLEEVVLDACDYLYRSV